MGVYFGFGSGFLGVSFLVSGFSGFFFPFPQAIFIPPFSFDDLWLGDGK